ncbi:hypothetical protein FACS1894176_08100 [Bacteroidia bacterium]|nr:hypothetical protein FACS1894176_08100 [Bacteroidia bacterium]
MSEKRNLQDIAVLLSEKANITKKEAELFLKESFETIQDGLLKDQSVKISGLGTFKLTAVGERESVDVTTGNRVILPAHYKVGFTPDATLAETVNEPFALFDNVELDEEAAIDADEEVEATEEVEAPPIGTQLRPVIQEEYEYELPPPIEEENKKGGCGWFVTTLLILLLGLGAYAYLSYQRERQSTLPEEEEWEYLPADTLQYILEGQETTVLDSVPEQTVDTIATAVVETKSAPVQATASASARTHIIQTGERLTLIALKEYGNKIFWVYLYEENKQLIPHPDLLEIGTKITIPPATKYGINSSDVNAVRKAKQLAALLENQLNDQGKD